MKIEIIYEDPSMLVVNKPSGLLTISDRYNPDKPTLFKYLAAGRDELFTVHRLDKETSGVICFAKTAEAHNHLSQEFQNRRVKKKYLAVVTGLVSTEEGLIETGLAQDKTHPGRMKTTKGGKKSLTLFRLLEKFKTNSLLEVDIKTGRMHQIRVHLKSIGHPCLVDKIYGGREAIFISDIKQRNLRITRKEDAAEIPLISRTTLHASELSLTHPVSQEVMTFQAELPKDMRALINQLRKWK